MDIKDAILSIPELLKEIKEWGILFKEKFSATPPPMRKFIEYLKSDAYMGENFAEAEYPWDECIEDNKDADCPECVCQAIKQRTVKHLIEQKLAKDPEEAIAVIVKKFKDDPIAKHLAEALSKQKPNTMDNKEFEEKMKAAEEKFTAELQKVQTSTEEKISAIQKKADETIEKFTKEISAKTEELVTKTTELLQKISDAPGAETSAKIKDKYKKDANTNSLSQSEIDKWMKEFA